jgi:hypothetical protein
MELLMEIPTIEQYNTTLDAVQVEEPCEDSSCYHCQIRRIFSESNLAHQLVNTILDRFMIDCITQPISHQMIGNMIVDSISHGIITGLRIAEVRELEKLNQ